MGLLLLVVSIQRFCSLRSIDLPGLSCLVDDQKVWWDLTTGLEMWLGKHLSTDWISEIHPNMCHLLLICFGSWLIFPFLISSCSEVMRLKDKTYSECILGLVLFLIVPETEHLCCASDDWEQPRVEAVDSCLVSCVCCWTKAQRAGWAWKMTDVLKDADAVLGFPHCTMLLEALSCSRSCCGDVKQDALMWY